MYGVHQDSYTIMHVVQLDGGIKMYMSQCKLHALECVRTTSKQMCSPEDSLLAVVEDDDLLAGSSSQFSSPEVANRP